MSKFLVSALTVAAVVLGSSVALAAPTDKGAVKVSEQGDDYGYEFKDDLLSAGMMGAQTAMIKVRQGAVRRTLIRPRTHFIPELFKSVEQI